MTFRLLSPELVDSIHDAVLNPGELRGRARDTSLDAALARVDNRLACGMIGDVVDLAAALSVAIDCRRCVSDGNRRAAFQGVDVRLHLHGVQATWETEVVSEMVIRAAQGQFDEAGFAACLRTWSV